MLSFIQEAFVKFLYIIGNQLIIGSGISFGLYIYYVLNIVHNTLSERIYTLQQELVFGDSIQIFIQIGFHIYHRTYL